MSHTLNSSMKTKLTLCVALLAATSAQAQVFRPEAVNGALLGGIAGGIIGHQSGGNNGWQGAALGAAAGLLIGQAVGEANDDVRYGRGDYVYRSRPAVSVGIGYSHGYYGPYRHGVYHGHRGYRGTSWGISYGPAFGYGYGYHRAYGAGYPYYGYGDTIYYRPASQPVVVAPPQPVVVSAPAAPAAQPAPQPVTIINNYYNTPAPMSGANALFGR